MKRGTLFAGAVLLAGASLALAQQTPDLEYKPPLPRPAYELSRGPRIAVDEAHHNFHTAQDRYLPFAELLRRDGYHVGALKKTLSPGSLEDIDVLVIANALDERNESDWSLPTPSAFGPDEMAALRVWVEKGKSLFLIADHMPFAGAAGELARAFGVEFSNGFAVAEPAERPSNFTFAPGAGLVESAVTRGRGEPETVTKVVTFVGSAFKPPRSATAVLALDAGYVSLRPTEAWKFSAETPKDPLDGWCQGAVLKFKKGRVAVFGEAAMFTAQLVGPARLKVGMNGEGAEQNHQLLLNVMHWLTRAEGLGE